MEMLMPHTHACFLKINPLARLVGQDGVIVDADQIMGRASQFAQSLAPHLVEGEAIGLMADNSVDWVVADLGLQCLNVTVIPIPGFFTPIQIQHLLQSHRVRVVIAPTNGAGAISESHLAPLSMAGVETLALYRQTADLTAAVAGSVHQKITFTSGSTADPKGISLTSAQQWTVAQALGVTLAPVSLRRHLVMLPLSVLLENVAGVYTGLYMGAEVIVPGLSAVGLTGSSGFNAVQALNTIESTGAQSVILLPQMLRDITQLMESSGRRLPQLKLVAVGGGKVAPDLIHRARAQGLPVFEGYGLSETASVVALNRPGKDRVGSVGQPLPHLEVQIAHDGEILVGPSAEWAAQHGASTVSSLVSTGDIGRLDRDGFLFVTGRKKNILITGFGRNVSPEWPEALLVGHDLIAQAFVYGEGQPRLSALIVPRDPATARETMALAIDQVNSSLPDYAQVGDWQMLLKPFSHADGLLTANGRMRREAIARFYQKLMGKQFKSTPRSVAA